MTKDASRNDKPPFTHTAWMLKTELIRKGRRSGRWIDEGVARAEPDGKIWVYLHSTPIGGIRRADLSGQNRRPAARRRTSAAAAWRGQRRRGRGRGRFRSLRPEQPPADGHRREAGRDGDEAAEFFGGGEPKLTPMQVHDRARAAGNEETLHARAYAAHEQQTEAERDERIFNQDRQQQQEDFAARYGVPGGSSGRDRASDDDYDRGRERER